MARCGYILLTNSAYISSTFSNIRIFIHTYWTVDNGHTVYGIMRSRVAQALGFSISAAPNGREHNYCNKKE